MDSDLLGEFRLLSKAALTAPLVAFANLRQRALDLDERKIAAMCLHFMAQRSLNLSERVKLERQLVKEFPAEWTYSSLAHTERDRGRLESALDAFRVALSLSNPADAKRRTFLADRIREVEQALAGDRSIVDRRIALRRCALAMSRVTRATAKKEFAHLRRYARRFGRDKVLSALYLEGLLDVAKAIDSKRRHLAYARELAVLRNTAQSYQRAAEEFQTAGHYLPAMSLLRKAMWRARIYDPQRLKELEGMYRTLRQQVREGSKV
jgi:tetratricopeptide (TPR) repeat protein